MKKNILVVTGGAGFIGSNLIDKLREYKKFKIISIDNYSSGSTKNHIISSNVKYVKSDTKNISKILNKYKKKIHTIFHFGEFSRIAQSFELIDKCYEYNIIGSKEVFSFCLRNNIKLIYSATSAIIGKQSLKNLSPYAFTKSKNLELLENLKRWFDLKFEIIYFYNVYGNKQISKGKMATVIGIFEDQYLKKVPLTVVKPGTQTRKFTHISDTIKVCFYAWKKNKCKHYSIYSKQNYSILQIAKMFGGKIKYLAPRPGERYSSRVVKKYLSNNITLKECKISIKKYIMDYKKKIK